MRDKVKLLPKEVKVVQTVPVTIPEFLWKFLFYTWEHFKPEPTRLPGPITLFDARCALQHLSVHEAGAEYGVSVGRMMVSFMSCFDEFDDSMTLESILKAPEPEGSNASAVHE
jgi:hypothetical protein